MATIRDESISMWEKPKWKRNVVMQKMVTVNSRKYNVQFVMKAMILTIAICSRIKHLRRETKFYGRKKLCYGCYSLVSQDHNAKTCKQRRTYKICKQSHPTGLHGYLPNKKQPKVTSDPKDGVPPVTDRKLMASNFAEMDIKCNSSSIESKIISMCVVPVKVSHSKSKKIFYICNA